MTTVTIGLALALLPHACSGGSVGIAPATYLPMTPKAPRILVVDDGHDAADSLGMVLRMFGADSTVVYDGESALEAIKASVPDIILLDLTMPDMDGYEVAQRIRVQPEYDRVRLIALTGWGTDEERRRSEAAGFSEHWVKPVPAATLRSLVTTAIEKNAQQSN